MVDPILQAGRWLRADDEYAVVDGSALFTRTGNKNKLTEAMVMGTPVVALCGKVWVPSRAPEKFPVCPECKEIWESLNPGGPKGGGDQGGGDQGGGGSGE